MDNTTHISLAIVDSKFGKSKPQTNTGAPRRIQKINIEVNRQNVSKNLLFENYNGTICEFTMNATLDNVDLMNFKPFGIKQGTKTTS